MKRKYSQEEVSKHMHGRIYFNRDDANVFVRRKNSGSLTMNLGNKWAWLIMGAELLFVLLVLLIIL